MTTLKSSGEQTIDEVKREIINGGIHSARCKYVCAEFLFANNNNKVDI